MSPSPASSMCAAILRPLRDDLVGGLGQRGTTYGQRSRAISTQSELHPVGVAEYDLDLVGRNGQFFRHDLRKGRLMALTVIVRPNQHRDIACHVDPHCGAFEDAGTGAERLDDARRRQAARLHIGAEDRCRGVCRVISMLPFAWQNRPSQRPPAPFRGRLSDRHCHI